LFLLFVRDRLSGTTTKKIRTDHEILTRENEKLVRKLDQVIREQQTQPGGKHVAVAEEKIQSGQEVKYFISKLIISLFYIRSIHRIIIALLKILMNLMKKCLSHIHFFFNVSVFFNLNIEWNLYVVHRMQQGIELFVTDIQVELRRSDVQRLLHDVYQIEL